jgi:pyruvate ferredoxin oxidoreductase alpha subunit
LVNAAVKSREILQGSVAIAETVKAVEPGVIAVYPITPQTHILEHLARLVADGKMNSRYITVDSEFSAASVVYGSSAAGVRSYTASASQGLLLMAEVVFNMAGTRLPVVFTAVNRSISPPINIQVDHQDTMTLRDSGVIQLYVESIQEAVDTHIQIFKIAEDREILLPAMVCMDGWILSHAYEPVTLWKEEAVREFLPPFEPVFKVDPKVPLTYGALTDAGKITEFRFMVHDALIRSKKRIKAAADEFRDAFGNFYGGLIEETYTEDADTVLVAMGSAVATIKAALREMREEGRRVGLIKVRSFRPFPDQEIREALKRARVAVVLDRSFSCSFGGILGGEIKSSLYGSREGPRIINYAIGIGGREIYPDTVKDVVAHAERLVENGDVPDRTIFYNLNKELL